MTATSKDMKWNQAPLVQDLNQKSGDGKKMKKMAFLVVGFMAISVMFSVSVVLRYESWDDARFMKVLEVIQFHDDHKVAAGQLYNKDKLLDGLLSPGFEESSSSSCISRYESPLYRKESPHKPSPYLITRLRKYEALHKRCGPYTEPYNRTVSKLKSNETEVLHEDQSSSDCRYLIWVAFSGLGNRIVTLASTFLYALLTDRVLIVDPGTDMADLFCDPFPQVTWFLPSDFPLKGQFRGLTQKSPECFGKMMKDGNTSTSGYDTLKYVYFHIIYNYDASDKLFFCEENQKSFEKVPWLIMRTDNYFVPALFLMPSFQQELSDLFPKKDLVFHFLSRYLFHPTNQVWGPVTRYYNGYLGKADERVGIQVRVFGLRSDPGPFKHVLDQIVSCALRKKVLPEISKSVPGNSTRSYIPPKSKAVLVTSLSSWYSDKLRDVYWEHPTTTGEVLAFLQPSHEELQRTDKGTHNRKAWAEMYLLSFSDVLITSAWSTFGYVAQGLGGLRPWILYKPENRTAPDPPCQQVLSMEPCFHSPPRFDCNAKKGVNMGEVVPHVRHCEDVRTGLKLVDSDDQ